MQLKKVTDYRLGRETYKCIYNGYVCTINLIFRRWRFIVEKYTKDRYVFFDNEESYNTLEECVDACKQYIDNIED